MAKKSNAKVPQEKEVADENQFVSQSNVHIDLTQELYRSFDFFNRKFANGRLVRPIIIVASNWGKKAHGWFAPELWTDDEGIALHEILISSESLKRGPTDILETLLHEMAHLKNHQENISDCSATQRHNKFFKAAAESFGLGVTQSVQYGYGHTHLTPIAMKAINELEPNYELYRLYKNAAFAVVQKERKASSLKPVMVDFETKKLAEELSVSLNVPQKNIASMAIKYLKHCMDSGIELPAEFLL